MPSGPSLSSAGRVVSERDRVVASLEAGVLPGHPSRPTSHRVQGPERLVDGMDRRSRRGKGLSTLAAALSITVSIAIFAPAARSWFGDFRGFPAGPGPDAIATGNFGRDSIRDLAVANSNGVAILDGKGGGEFARPRTFPAGSIPTSLVSGRFNADDRPDLAVAALGGNEISILIGNGDGTFSGPTGFATAPFPQQVASGYFDSDSSLDLAATTQGGVSVLLGNGDGTFGSATEYGAGSVEARGIAVADLDRDLDLDIAFTDRDQNLVRILLGNGDGSFSDGGSKPTVGTGPASISIGDLDRDLDPDLVTANFGSNSISLLLGRGDGTFRAAKTFTVWSRNANQVWPNSVTVRDLNGDSVPDPVVTLQRAKAIAVLIGNGEGSFARTRLYPTGREPMGVAVGNLNRGTNPDLAVAARDSNSVSVLLNSGPSRRTVSLSWQLRNRKFSGRIKSSDPTCFRSQNVPIMKRRPGPDRTIAIAVTDRTGSFGFRRGARNGRYYAKVRAWSACRSDRSRVVTVRRD